jgi:hypothetical protein
MKKIVSLIVVLIVSVACGSNSIKKISKNKIDTITLIVDSTMVNPTVFKNRDIITLNSNLTITHNNKEKKLTKKQYQDIVNEIKDINLSKLKSTKLKLPLLGSSLKKVIIKKGQKEYHFISNSTQRFPKEINKLANKMIKY